MTFGHAELARLLRSERDQKVSVTLTRVRQVISLHPKLSIDQKERLNRWLKALQKNMLSAPVNSDNHREIKESEKIIDWCRDLTAMCEKLERYVSRNGNNISKDFEETFSDMLEKLNISLNLLED